ncbi:MAG: NAD(P)-dependent oxidoreductase [Spirochaetes bacterium]|jgi:dTDP-4-dehydrorhamnose reductase|nr:NAD(P)-dependent oxidoreductase [Spirochaetota bacterium]
MKLLIGNNKIAELVAARNVSGCLHFRIEDSIKLSDPDYLKHIFSENNPDTVINCMDFGLIDDAERFRSEAYRVNALFPGALASCCKNSGAFLISLGSAYSCGGRKSGPYREEDEMVPISAYGDSKLLGENLIAESGCDHAILRIGDCYDENFFHGLGFINRTNDSLEVISGAVISPASPDDVADAVIRLAENRSRGLFFFSNTGLTSPVNFVDSVVDIYSRLSGKALTSAVRELDQKEFLSPADRPMNASIDPAKFENTAGSRITGWRQALEKFIENNLDKITIECVSEGCQ